MDNYLRTPSSYRAAEGYIAHVITREGGHNYHAPRVYAQDPICATQADAETILGRALLGPAVVAGYVEHFWTDPRGAIYGIHREMVSAWRRPHKVYANNLGGARIQELGSPIEDTWRDLRNLEPLARQSD